MGDYRELLAWQATDLLDETAERLKAYRIRSVEDVRAATVPLVGPGEPVGRMKQELEQFLRERVSTSELVTLESAHLSNVECAGEFTEAVLDFLQAQGRRPKA